MKKGIPKNLVYTKRFGQLTASSSIKTIYDAIIELVTNSDDSYRNMGKNDGKILIEVERHQQNSKLIVRDMAEGMTLEEMEKKLCNVGERTGTSSSRGFMGRGAKDIHVLGELTFESIKDGYLHKSQITNHADFVPFKPDKGKNQKASDSDYKRLHIKKGKNGLTVIVTLQTNIKMPQFDNLKKSIPLLYPLRDILNEKDGRPVLLRNIVDKRREKIQYRDPADAELICAEEFEIEGYPNCKAKFQLYQTKERIPTENSKLRRNGILIKGKNAIHEITFFDSTLESNQLNEYFFGRLECPYIDELAEEYDNCRNYKQPIPDNNPMFIIDPQRQGGLAREHPFVEKLFQLPKERLRKFLKEKEGTLKEKAKEIESSQTKKRLHELSQKLSKIIDKQLEDPLLNTYGQRDDYEGIIPASYTLALNEEKTFILKLKKRPNIDLNNTRAIVECNDTSIKILSPEFLMSQSKYNSDFITGSFKLKGEKKTLAAEVIVDYGDIGPLKTIIAVAEKMLPEMELTSPLEFEHEFYNVQEGRKRNLKLRAKYPDIISEDTIVYVSTDNDDITIRGQCILKPYPRLNIAEGTVVVEGRKLHAKAKITAKVNGRQAITNVKVGQIPAGFNFQTVLKDEYFGRRALWHPNIDSPVELLISIQHPSVKRYLGVKSIDKGKENWEGQEKPHFRTVIAEIASDAVCRLILERSSKELEELEVAALLSRYQSLMAEVSPLAHEVMLSNIDLEKLN